MFAELMNVFSSDNNNHVGYCKITLDYLNSRLNLFRYQMTRSYNKHSKKINYKIMPLVNCIEDMIEKLSSRLVISFKSFTIIFFYYILLDIKKIIKYI